LKSPLRIQHEFLPKRLFHLTSAARPTRLCDSPAKRSQRNAAESVSLAAWKTQPRSARWNVTHTPRCAYWRLTKLSLTIRLLLVAVQNPPLI
jgi:hypothetical protein